MAEPEFDDEQYFPEEEEMLEEEMYEDEDQPKGEVFWFNGKPLTFPEYRRYSQRLDPNAAVPEVDAWFYSDKNSKFFCCCFC